MSNSFGIALAIPIAIAIVGKLPQQYQQQQQQLENRLSNSNTNSNSAKKGNSNSSFNTIAHVCSKDASISSAMFLRLNTDVVHNDKFVYEIIEVLLFSQMKKKVKPQLNKVCSTYSRTLNLIVRQFQCTITTQAKSLRGYNENVSQFTFSHSALT